MKRRLVARMAALKAECGAPMFATSLATGVVKFVTILGAMFALAVLLGTDNERRARFLWPSERGRGTLGRSSTG